MWSQSVRWLLTLTGLGLGCLSWSAAEPPRSVTASPPARARPSILLAAVLERAETALQQDDAGLAVRLLESELQRAGPQPALVDLLVRAYRQRLAELQAAGRNDLAQVVQQRLAQLTHTSRVANGPRDEIGPKADNQPVPLAPQDTADRLFIQRRYAEAARWYQEAAQQTGSLPALARERWAYCKLYLVTSRLNDSTALRADEAERLERELRAAQTLAPRLEFTQTLLTALAQRRQSAVAAEASSGPTSRPAWRHLPATGGWQVAASAHFRVYHHNAELAEQVLSVAERTREAVAHKWLGRPLPAWPMTCDIYVHVNATAYSQATGAPSDSPGHSSIGAERTDASRLHSLRVDVRADHAHLLSAVLPHEITHVVLAGQTGPVPIPRWADEGIAVLSETYERIGRHLTHLPQFYDEGRAFTALELLTLTDYPDPGRMGAFYGQSACLVQYLSELRGPVEVLEFVKSLSRKGPEEALRQHYGLTPTELDERLRRFILVEHTPSLQPH